MEKHLAEGLKRPIQPMPPDVKKRINDAGLMKTYHARPAYQQNDYLGWISRAKREDTREKRILQMLAELAQGNVYMRMSWNPLTSRKG